MATEQEIRDDIAHIYRKIDQCYRSKADLEQNIEKERTQITELGIYIAQDEIRQQAGKKTRYDLPSMHANVERCKENIKLFHKTIDTESNNIKRFLEVVSVLQEDLKRPKEIVFDAKTGKLISSTGD